ncbi:MAG TPA: hypothetical protein VES79_04100 [Solirubrobacteraceae bacterium]|nr:hypothetical protein [Solirubrobacteraceae bacterium]
MRGLLLASRATVACSGHGYNRSRVSVLLLAPDVVDVIVPRIAC